MKELLMDGKQKDNHENKGGIIVAEDKNFVHLHCHY